MTKKTPRPRQKSKSALCKQADKLFSEFRRAEVGHCECCGKKDNLQLAHIITRGCRKLRYDPDNTFVLCWSCHWKFHSKPLEFAEFVKNRKGEDVYKYLLKASQILHPIDRKFYEIIIQKYARS